ncbi:MAG: hypothetical protein GC201_00150 [Alphaproteobacteria bacterium]|nr:hypothetical protein [Alphaproteobacteria bacterium]
MAYTNVKDVLSRVQQVTEYLGIQLVDPNQHGIFGDTPLHVAAGWGEVDAVRLLLDAGAMVDSRGERNDTPLYSAVSSGNLDVVRLLVDRGASTKVTNDDGDSPLDSARWLKKEEIAEFLRTLT